MNVFCKVRNCGRKNLLEISVKEKCLRKHKLLDSSAKIRLSKRFRSLHNWIFIFVKHRWVAISLTQQKKMKNYSVNSTNFSRNFLLWTKSETKEERHTNEICFYTYDHLLDIFLNIRVSHIWTNNKRRVLQ